MKIETSKGKAYNVEWIDSPITNPKMLYLSMADNRRLPKIAAEFDGLTEIRRYSEEQGNKTFTGYSKLVEIGLSAATGMLQIALMKEE